MKWTKDQQKIINARDNNILVSAAAGSGKTAVLVERIIQMLFDSKKPVNIDELLVCTFTNAAASQMKDKIAKAIEKKIDENPENEFYVHQLNMIGQANILTIDSFCYKIVKEYFHVLGLDPGLQIAEETELVILRQRILENVIEKAYENNKDFSDFSSAYSADKNDNDIEEYIVRLYELSQSYSYPEVWLDRAAQSLKISSEKDFNDLPYIGVFISEIRYQAEGIRETMEDMLEHIRRPDGPVHYEKAVVSDMNLIDSIIAANTYERLSKIELVFEALGRPKKGQEYDTDMADEIKKARDKYKKNIAKILEPFSVPLNELIKQYKKQEKLLSAFVDVTKEFSRCFLQEKLNKGIVGFSDIEHFALELLCDGIDEDGDPIPSAIANELSDQFKEILIDEYQDSNYLQEDILKCVSRISKGCNNMFMVGDVKQSIYSFRMARPDLFIGKYNTYKMLGEETDNNASGYKILLKNNFRSRANVLYGINYIFNQIMRRELGGIEYGKDEELVPGKDYLASASDNIELLIGESKEYDYLEMADKKSAGIEGDNDQDNEHLDDEYIDVGSVELEASIVASRIRSLMGNDGDDRFVVEYGDDHETRPLQYRDIVILFRSPKGCQAIFSEILKSHNIPVKVQNENGYFDTVEILALMSLLNVIDNPFNDVEFVALLRGYFGGLSSEELAILSLLKKEYCALYDKAKDRGSGYNNYYSFTAMLINNDSLFESLCDSSGTGDMITDKELFINKLKRISELISKYHDMKKVLSVSELITEIYYGTDYYYYVVAMPEGRDRCRNLSLLLEEARHFESVGCRTLFDFLQYSKKLAEKGVALGGDPSVDDVEDAVRIMSVHKSKGLEFPVVFVSGTGKQFNLADTKKSVILHPDYYINAKYVDVLKRYGHDTFGRLVMTSLITAESIAEELRILYVALTRAKEKLIITGVTSDALKLIEKYKKVVSISDTKLDYNVIRNSENYLEMIVAAMMRNETFHKAAESIKPRYDKRGNIISGVYELKNIIDAPDVRFTVRFFDYTTILVSRVETGKELGLERMDTIRAIEKMPALSIKELNSRINYNYRYSAFVSERSKLSVTEIKRRYETDFKESYDTDGERFLSYGTDDLKEEKHIVNTSRNNKYLPGFISDTKPMDAAMKGTWMHKVMELVDFKKTDSLDDVKRELERLYYDGHLPDETRTFIKPEKIYNMLCSELGKRMRTAANKRLLFKEKKFITGVPVFDNGDTQRIVVQGIIDAYFKENEHLVLIDYKTDKIKDGQEQLLIERYNTQMRYYKDTLEQLTGLCVAEVYLYSFALDKEIKL